MVISRKGLVTIKKATNRRPLDLNLKIERLKNAGNLRRDIPSAARRGSSHPVVAGRRNMAAGEPSRPFVCSCCWLRGLGARLNFKRGQHHEMLTAVYAKGPKETARGSP